MAMNRMTLWATWIGICLSTSLATAADETISVRGHAQVTLPADSAVITATIDGRAIEAEKAFELVEEKSQDVADFLKQSGIALDAVRLQPTTLSRYAIRPMASKAQQSSQGSGANRANGNTNEEGERVAYSATRQLYISLSDLKKLNLIHLGLIQRGIDRLDKVEFKSSKSVEEYAKLRLAAVRDARSKAAAMVTELGAELKSIRSMVDQSSPFPTNHTPSSRTDDSDPFGGGMGMGGGYGEGASPIPTLVTHIASVDIVFNLGKTELTK
ncbi:MAG: SIMPL domain-containing protein [Pirellulaceae bacterium]|nr:SIMPL domain-containing protein [Pirellulaceae bacterium]